MLVFEKEAERREKGRQIKDFNDIQRSPSESALDGSGAQVVFKSSGQIDMLILNDYFFVQGERQIPFKLGTLILRFDETMLDVFLERGTEL